MHVTQLWRFPVKSMGGESLDSAHLGDLGIEGDRGWGVFDVASGTVLTARRSPQLLFASARLDGEDLVIDLRNGRRLGWLSLCCEPRVLDRLLAGEALGRVQDQ